MKKRFVTLSCLVALMALLLPAATALATDVSHWYVKSPHGYAKIYSEMSTKSKVLTKVSNGKKVTVYDLWYGSKWADCSYKGYYGYIRVEYLRDHKPSPTHKPTPKPTHKPTKKPVAATPTPTVDPYADFAAVEYMAKVTPHDADSYVHLRWAPTTDSSIITDYYAGVELEVLAENSTWAQVRNPLDGQVGYMMKSFLTETAAVYGAVDEEGEAIVDPMHEAVSFAELTAAQPEIAIKDAPTGATGVTYEWIDGEPVIAQISFTMGADVYCYRAAYCESAEEVQDIDGIYDENDTEEAFGDGVTLHIFTDEAGYDSAFATWYDAAAKTQYSLYSPTAGNPALRIKDVLTLLVG